MVMGRNDFDGSLLASTSREVKKATIVSLLKSMAAKRGEEKQMPIYLNRNSELFQSYLEQRRTPRSGEYPFLGPLFRDEVHVTTPPPDKFIGGASLYKPSTPSPIIDDVEYHDSAGSSKYNYKIIDETNQPISIPSLEVKQPTTTKPTPLKESSVEHANSFNDNGLKNQAPHVLKSEPLRVTGGKNEKNNIFPSFQNQFYKHHRGTTPRPASELFKQIDKEVQNSPLKLGQKEKQTFSDFSKDVSKLYTTPSTIFTTYRNNPVTTIKYRPTSRPTQKYYMNLVTDQSYKPLKTYITNSDVSPGSYYKDSQPSTIINKPDNTPSSFSYKPHKTPVSSEVYISNENTKYESIDKPKFYYKPVLQAEVQTEEPKFYYKPAKPESQTKKVVYKEAELLNTYVNPFSSNEGDFNVYESPKKLPSNAGSSYHSSVVASEIENATPHPLIYGFKPVGSISSTSSDHRSPKYLATGSKSTPIKGSQYFSPYHAASTGNHGPHGSQSFAISKPIRFPYDKRHYYSGRFVSSQ